MSRRMFLLGLGLALMALALAVTDWALSLQPGVTEANVKRIKPGMTLREVEAILGGPGKGWAGGPRGHSYYQWSGPHGTARVNFRPGYGSLPAVTSAWFTRDDRPQPGPLARLRAWLGW